MTKAVRMADIAQKLGVSTVTVSKALGNQKGVSEEMRAKIRQLADEMGYRAPVPVRTEEKRSYTLGVLMPSTSKEKFPTFYWEIYQKIILEAAKRNCFVLLEVLEEQEELQTPDLKLQRENRIDALLIMGIVRKEYLIALKARYSLPMILVDFYNNNIKEDSVISNGFYGTSYLTDYLFSKGHTDIGFVGTIQATDSIMDRYLGYSKSMMEHGKSIRQDWVVPDRDESRWCFDRIELPQQLPTAFVCNCDLTASKVVKALHERGLRVPEDVSVVGYDDYLYPGLCDVPLTTYSVDMQKMAEYSVESILRKIAGEPYQSGLRVVCGRIVERESVKSLL